VDCIELENPALRQALLLYVWDEFPRHQRVLLAWLREMGRSGSAEESLRAAEAVGELSVRDFPLVCEQVIKDWTRDTQFGCALNSTTLALSVAASQPDRAILVQNLLHHWITLPDNPLLRLIAALTHSEAGKHFPQAAVRDLVQIAQMDSNGSSADVHAADSVRYFWFDIACFGILSLLHTGPEPDQCDLKALQELCACADASDDPIRALTSLQIFLLLAREDQQQALTPTQNGDEVFSETWPSLLWLAGESSTYRQAIKMLFLCALRHPQLQPEARDTLQIWFVQVDEILLNSTNAELCERLYAALGNLTNDLIDAGGERESENLFYYLQTWQVKERRNVAAKILKVIQQSRRPLE
jgi:hypothetical protein